jgi:hypothetical protein
MKPMPRSEDADEAFDLLNPGRKSRKGRKGRSLELSPELEAALKNIPAGFRLGYGPDGSLKLVKTRVRTKKGA